MVAQTTQNIRIQNIDLLKKRVAKKILHILCDRWLIGLISVSPLEEFTLTGIQRFLTETPYYYVDNFDIYREKPENDDIISKIRSMIYSHGASIDENTIILETINKIEQMGITENILRRSLYRIEFSSLSRGKYIVNVYRDYDNKLIFSLKLKILLFFDKASIEKDKVEKEAKELAEKYKQALAVCYRARKYKKEYVPALAVVYDYNGGDQ